MQVKDDIFGLKLMMEFPKMRTLGKEQVWGKRLAMTRWRQWDDLMTMLKSQLELKVWGSGKCSGLEMYIRK